MGTDARVERRGWRHWLYAKLLARFSAKYEPMIIERKSELLGGLTGEIIEIGPGAGVNLKFLDEGARWVGVDPNPYMEPYVRREAERRGVSAEFRLGAAEDLPADTGSADAIISTLVLCGVGDVDRALEEVLRVLKPGGRFCFIEHVAAPHGTRTRRRQDWICPLWKRLADGCHPNRESWRHIEQAGFAAITCEHFRLDLPIAGPHIAGCAVKGR